MAAEHANPDDIRALFSRAMSAMYRDEVPAYGTLMELVRDVNADVLATAPDERARLEALGELERIDEERHGAIRLGTARELFTMRRLFAVMGMHPVGYYDLSVAGVPVHSTAFRPLDEASLRRNPFRVFTSLLRLDLVADAELRAAAAEVLEAREIYTPGCLALIDRAEADGGLSQADAERFVAEALETFRWHAEANVPHDLYRRLPRRAPADRRRGGLQGAAHQPPDPAHARHRPRAGDDARARHHPQGGRRGPADPERADPAAPDLVQGAGRAG